MRFLRFILPAMYLYLGLILKLQTFLYLTGNGVVQGMRPLIGYNYGAGESKRVREIFRSALVLIAGVMVIGTILCMAVPQTLIGLFTSNPETIQFGKEALRLISIDLLRHRSPSRYQVRWKDWEREKNRW